MPSWHEPAFPGFSTTITLRKMCLWCIFSQAGNEDRHSQSEIALESWREAARRILPKQPVITAQKQHVRRLVCFVTGRHALHCVEDVWVMCGVPPRSGSFYIIKLRLMCSHVCGANTLRGVAMQQHNIICYSCEDKTLRQRNTHAAEKVIPCLSTPC